MSGYLLNVIHCANTRKVMRKALDAGWEWVGYTKAGHVEIRWPETGALLHCATTPSDPNGYKQFARNVQQISGIQVLERGNRRRSRRPLSKPDLHAASVARKWRAEQERKAVAAQRQREQEQARERAARASTDSDRRQRDIEALMRPRYGR